MATSRSTKVVRNTVWRGGQYGLYGLSKGRTMLNLEKVVAKLYSVSALPNRTVVHTGMSPPFRKSVLFVQLRTFTSGVWKILIETFFNFSSKENVLSS